MSIINRNGTCIIRILGKGRKERTNWKTTQNYLTEFFKETGDHGEDKKSYSVQELPIA
jgi:hypothetical protein